MVIFAKLHYLFHLDIKHYLFLQLKSSSHCLTTSVHLKDMGRMVLRCVYWSLEISWCWSHT